MNSEQLKAYIGVAHYVQQQADWTETNTDSVQYIKNKPNIDITDFKNDFDNHVSFVAQKINDIQIINDTQDSQINTFDSQINTLETDMLDAQNRIGDLSVKSNDHINRIITLETKANTNASNISQIDADLQSHSQFAGNKFNGFDIRIDKLETDTASLEANIITLQATDKGYDTRISTVESNTTSNTQRIGTLEATTSLTLPTLDQEYKALKSRLDNIEGRVLVLDNFKTLVETKITDLTNRIKALEGNS